MRKEKANARKRGTLYFEQHLQQFRHKHTHCVRTSIKYPSDASSSRLMYSADVERRVQEGLRGIQQRQQKVAEGHSQAVGQLNDILAREYHW